MPPWLVDWQWFSIWWLLIPIIAIVYGIFGEVKDWLFQKRNPPPSPYDWSE